MGTALMNASGSRAFFAAHDIISAVLGNPSRTENFDHSWRLQEALKYAEDCKESLLAEHYVDALVYFVKACGCSTYCLESLEDYTIHLREALHVTGHKHAKQFTTTRMPHVYKAAKIIMLSNNKLDAMSEKQKFSLLLEDTGTCADWQVRQLLLQLTDQDVEWVTCVASYRAIYRMAVENQTKGIGEHNGEAYVVWAKEAAQHLRAMAPDHPAALEAAVQVDLLQGLPPSSPDPMQMERGYDHAIHECTDPALAMNHILQSMYMILQVHYGRPDESAQKALLNGADNIAELHHFMLHHRGLWDHVKGRLVASMLMLANTWPLAQVLDDHPLVGFINAQHRRLREQLLQAKMQQQRMQEEAHRASDRDAASPAKDSQGEEEEEVLVQEVVCARCEKFLRKQMEKVECQECHVTFYCSNECMKKHAVVHKSACKRAKLRSKLASKPSTR